MRICKNDITDELRRLFGANPLKIPDSIYQPLLLIEIVDNRAKILGQLHELIKGDFPYQLEIKTSELAEISGKKTTKVKLGFGLDILGNFFKGFGLPSIGIEAAIQNAKTIQFSFSNVKRKYFSPLALGKILSENSVVADPNNFVLQKIIQDKNHRLALVTDVIVSNSFSFGTYDESENSAAIDIPTIEGIVDAAKASISVEKKSESEVSFQRKTALTFAFSCIEIKIDATTGAFTRGDWLNEIKAKGINTTKEISPDELDRHSKLIIDDNEYNPLLIE